MRPRSGLFEKRSLAIRMRRKSEWDDAGSMCPSRYMDMPTWSGVWPLLSGFLTSEIILRFVRPLSTRCGSHERVRKVLRLPRYLVLPEFHNANRVRRPAVIGEDEFSDPEVTAAKNASDRKPLFVWLARALALYVAPAAGPLTRLRILQHRVLVVYYVLRFKIVGIGRRPMLIQRRADILISHFRRRCLRLLIVHLEPPAFCCFGRMILG